MKRLFLNLVIMAAILGTAVLTSCDFIKDIIKGDPNKPKKGDVYVVGYEANAQNKYIAKAYDRLNIVVPKGRKGVIQAVAGSQGESLNGFINVAVDERIERLGDAQGDNAECTPNESEGDA